MTEAGIMLSEVPFSNLPVILKKGGMDFFILDSEHGGFDYSDISKIIMTSRLAGLKCIVRLADSTRKDIIKFMDMGADGLLLPMTNTAADIEKVVEYAKYAPLGRRGLSTMRAHTLYDPPKLLDYMKAANEATEIYAQIETGGRRRKRRGNLIRGRRKRRFDGTERLILRLRLSGGQLRAANTFFHRKDGVRSCRAGEKRAALLQAMKLSGKGERVRHDDVLRGERTESPEIGYGEHRKTD